MTKKLLLSFVLIGFVFVVGCSNKQQLTGTVTFSDDGSPVPLGAVFFTTPTFEAMGTIKPDGTYTVSSTGENDGIPKGQTYVVTIVGADDVKVTQGNDGRVVSSSRTPFINSKYTRKETSDLTFTSDGKTKRFDIQVERAPVK